MAFPGDHHESGGWGTPSTYGPDASYDHGPHPGSPFGSEEGPQPGHDGLAYENSFYEQSPMRPRPPAKRRSGGRSWLIVAVVAVGVALLGGGAGLVLASGNKTPTAPAPSPTPTAATTTPTPTPTETGRGQQLRSRATDPRPLKLNEVFRHRKFHGGGRAYLMTVRRADKVCSHGTHGTKFRRLLVRGGCSQVLRATFTNGKFIGTVGVLNLRTENGARIAQRASRPKDTFVMPLPGSGTTRKLGQGLSLTTAETDGHYLIMSWIQYPNGKKIAQRDYSAVTAFVQYTTLGSNLRPALNYRSMVGKPA